MQEFSRYGPRLQGDVDGPIAVVVGKVGGAAEPGLGCLSFLPDNIFLAADLNWGINVVLATFILNCTDN